MDGKDPNKKIVEIAARCPDCKKLHKVNTFCPITGNRMTIEQESLN
jgi:hypothetical protein